MQKFYWPSSCQDKNMNSSNEYKARELNNPWQNGNSLDYTNITQENKEAHNMDMSSITLTLPKRTREKVNMKHSENTNTAQSTDSAAVKARVLGASRENMFRIVPGGQRQQARK